MLPLLSLRHTATGAERTGEANVSDAEVPPAKPPKTCGCDGVLPDPRGQEDAAAEAEMQTEEAVHRRRRRIGPATVVVVPQRPPRWHWGWPWLWGWY